MTITSPTEDRENWDRFTLRSLYRRSHWLLRCFWILLPCCSNRAGFHSLWLFAEWRGLAKFKQWISVLMISLALRSCSIAFSFRSYLSYAWLCSCTERERKLLEFVAVHLGLRVNVVLPAVHRMGKSLRLAMLMLLFVWLDSARHSCLCLVWLHLLESSASWETCLLCSCYD